MIDYSKTSEMIGNYEDRKIDLTEINPDMEVSTVKVTDRLRYQYETAIIFHQEIYVVELYHTAQEAEEGHTRWVKDIPNRTSITDIDFDEEVSLI